MSEIILAVLCIVAGIIFGLGTVLVLWANAMGAVTNASAVNNWPALIFLLLAIAGIAGGISILLF
jgi:hypothetical protein